MNCQAMVELMQRNLDHDLSELEEQELLLHLQQCNECARLFERLRRLDQELAQLPKVTPAFGLVDSILPQLTELDRSQAAFEETAAREPLADAPSGGIPRIRRSAFSWRLTGGTAVAAAVIGLFIMKEQNLMPPSLGMKQSASTSASAKAADNMKSSASAPVSKDQASSGSTASKSDAGTHSVQAGSASDKTPAPPAAAAQPQQGTESAGTNRVAISSTGESSDGAAAGDKTVSPAPTSSPKPDAGVGTNASQPSSESAPPPASEPPASPESAQPDSAAPRAKGAVPPNTAPATHPFASLVTPKPDTAAQASATLSSPDGKLLAAVEDLKVVVRLTDTGSTVWKSTYSWQAADVITLVSFSADDKLSYHVQHPSGADDVVLDVDTGVETKTAAPAN